MAAARGRILGWSYRDILSPVLLKEERQGLPAIAAVFDIDIQDKNTTALAVDPDQRIRPRAPPAPDLVGILGRIVFAVLCVWRFVRFAGENVPAASGIFERQGRSEEHTSELQSRLH